MRTALHSLLICSVISGMAAGGKSSGVMSTERCIDSILQDYVKIANDADFHNETNNYRSVFQHSLLCKSSPECRCGVYSFLEVKSSQEALLLHWSHALWRGASSSSWTWDSKTCLPHPSVTDFLCCTFSSLFLSRHAHHWTILWSRSTILLPISFKSCIIFASNSVYLHLFCIKNLAWMRNKIFFGSL